MLVTKAAVHARVKPVCVARLHIGGATSSTQCAVAVPPVIKPAQVPAHVAVHHHLLSQGLVLHRREQRQTVNFVNKGKDNLSLPMRGLEGNYCTESESSKYPNH
jgi:hypothetical protein